MIHLSPMKPNDVMKSHGSWAIWVNHCTLSHTRRGPWIILLVWSYGLWVLS